MNQAKLANLGALIRGIEAAIPPALQKTMPAPLVHPHITFEVFPESWALQVSGHRSYTVLQRLIQLTTCPWLLPTGTQLVVLSSKLSREPEIADRRLHVHWRSVLPAEPRSPPPTNAPAFSLEPGRLVRSLGLLHHEYPILAGSFEFGFDSQCERILLHILRNVEYMEKPDSELICT